MHLHVIDCVLSSSLHFQASQESFFERMGNGAKAAQKRERNADKNGAKGSKSQAKSNEAAKSIICQTCRQAFFVTTRQPALEEHSQSRHNKTMAECFPNFQVSTK